MSTTVAPTESKWIPLPTYQCLVTVSASVAPGESGGGAFRLSIPGVDGDQTVADGTPWTLDYPCLGFADAHVTNTGATSLVFTTSPE